MAYLDHAASAPLRPEARDAWLEAGLEPGNPSAAHAAGRSKRRYLEDARERVAGALGVAPRTVVFTSGGTESDNTAIRGLVAARRRENPERDLILVSAVEHKAVLEPADAMRPSGVRTVRIRVDGRGRVELEHLGELLAENPGRVAVVSVMWANNEVGTVQPIERIAELSRAAGVPLHTDAVQAVGLPGVDLNLPDTAALSAHKFGGPVGFGILLDNGRYPLDPLIVGGGQESGRRAGTSNSAHAAAMAAALTAATADPESEAARLRQLRDELLAGVREVVPGVVVNGDPDHGLPGLVHLSLPGRSSESMLLLLDAAGIQVSVGSACSAGATSSSHVLAAMGIADDMARSSLRFSLGWSSTSADVAELLAVLPGIVSRFQVARGKDRDSENVSRPGPVRGNG